MADERIELSSSGVKLSYLRFLADAAAGLIIILLLIVGYYYNLLPGGHVVAMAREVKIFILLILLALAVPMGLFMNAIGWFLFGWLQVKGATCWFKHRKNLFAHATTENFSFEVICDSFGVTSENFFERARFHEDVAMIFHDHIAPSSTHARGIKWLIRSLVMIDIIYSFLFSFSPHFTPWCLLFVSFPVAVILLFTLTLLEYYDCLSMFQKAFILALDDSTVPKGEYDVLRRLIKRGLPEHPGSKPEKS